MGTYPLLLHALLVSLRRRFLAAFAKLAKTLDSVETDYVGRRWDFHQPLPPGLFALVLSRCAALCTEQTAIWRRDLFTVMETSGAPPMEVQRRQPRGASSPQPPPPPVRRHHR